MLTAWFKAFARNVFAPRKQMQSTFAPFYNENRWGDPESANASIQLSTPIKQIEEKISSERARFFGKTLALWKLADL